MGNKRSVQTILGQWHINCIARFSLSSETQGQSVGSGKKAGRKFSGKGGRAPGDWPSPNYFQKFKQIPAPDWAQKMLYCAQLVNSFSCILFVSSYTRAIVSPHLPGSFTKLVRTKETFIFYFPNQKQRNYRWVEKTRAIILNLPWEYSVFDGSQLRCGSDEKVK